MAEGSTTRSDAADSLVDGHTRREGLLRFTLSAELEDCLDVALKDKEAQKKMSKQLSTG